MDDNEERPMTEEDVTLLLGCNEVATKEETIDFLKEWATLRNLNGEKYQLYREDILRETLQMLDVVENDGATIRETILFILGYHQGWIQSHRHGQQMIDILMQRR